MKNQRQKNNNFIFLVPELSSQFDLFPDDDPIPDVPRGRHSYSSDRHNSPEMSLRLAEPTIRERSRSPRVMPPPARPRPRSRCIAPPTRLPAPGGLGCGLEELIFIRLISNMNPHRIFELRRYTFPENKPLQIRIGRNKYESMPTEEQIVLITYDGDIFAILETHNILAGLYTPDGGEKIRAKINVRSGMVTPLTRMEVIETQVGSSRPIMKYYRIQNLNSFANSPLYQ